MGPQSGTRVESIDYSSAPPALGELGTWTQFLPSGFFLDFFFFNRGIGPCGSVPLPPLEWISSPPLVAAVFITTKGAESPGSSRMGVIGALVIFFSI